jgi:hypothetical protein
MAANVFLVMKVATHVEVPQTMIASIRKVSPVCPLIMKIKMALAYFLLVLKKKL